MDPVQRSMVMNCLGWPFSGPIWSWVILYEAVWFWMVLFGLVRPCLVLCLVMFRLTYAAMHDTCSLLGRGFRNSLVLRRLMLNPIPYGISIPAVLRGGEKNTPPAKNIFRSVIFQFFYTYNESYVQLAKIKKKFKKFLKTAEKSNFWKIFGKFLEI